MKSVFPIQATCLFTTEYAKVDAFIVSRFWLLQIFRTAVA